ncbi:NAC domain-containing protein 62-like [Miscanthus floridulus]|uniref:NAC domain-containing protein 62-like n=1 Tax=Miscanthus floridulus TaxID=154761 RepID=UPI003459A84A
MATGPQYADTSAVGVRFHPTDQQLIGFLRMKNAGQQMPVKFFKDFDVYQAHPMAIKGACGESQDGCWYAFSPRDRKYRNGKRLARSVFAEGGGQQVGFWKSNSKLGEVCAGGSKDGAVIGRMTSLTFQIGRQPRGRQTGWKMKDSMTGCKLFYKERPGCTNTESKADENATSVGQERPIHGKSEKDKVKRPRRSRKSKKDKNAIPDAVGQEDGPGEAAGESMQGEEDMQPQMVPAAHQASDCSEQDLCVEEYLVCDVTFAQQNDAASAVPFNMYVQA